MKKAIRLQFLVTLILCVISFQSVGFWIGASALPESSHIHQKITEKAAKEYKYKPSIDKFNICNENGCTFTGSVINALKESNKSIDGGATADIHAYHCDAEKIEECADIIYDGRKKIVEEIITLAKAIKIDGNGSGDMKAVQTLLGQISHTLQDFYSHSNWVEREMFGLIVPVFTPYSYSKGASSPPPVAIYNDLINTNFTYEAPRRRTFCETTKKTISSGGTLLHLNSITSGYYDDRPDIHGIEAVPGSTSMINSYGISDGYFYSRVKTKNGAYYVNWLYSTESKVTINGKKPLYKYPIPKPLDVIEKCQHGNKFNNSPVGNSSHFGIAKDSPNRRHHAAAKLAAKTATTELIKAIESDVIGQEGKNKYVDAAILAFLGYPVKAWFVDVTDEEGNALTDYKLTVLNENGDEITSYDNSTSEKSDFIFFNTTPLRLGALPEDIKHYKIKVSKEGYETLETTCPYKNSIPLLNGSSPITCEIQLAHDDNCTYVIGDTLGKHCSYLDGAIWRGLSYLGDNPKPDSMGWLTTYYNGAYHNHYQNGSTIYTEDGSIVYATKVGPGLELKRFEWYYEQAIRVPNSYRKYSLIIYTGSSTYNSCQLHTSTLNGPSELGSFHEGEAGYATCTHNAKTLSKRFIEETQTKLKF